MRAREGGTVERETVNVKGQDEFGCREDACEQGECEMGIVGNVYLLSSIAFISIYGLFRFLSVDRADIIIKLNK